MMAKTKSKSMAKSSPSEREPAKSSMKKSMECLCASGANCCAGWGLLVLRVVVGALFVYHGVTKFQNWGMVQGFFGSLFGSAGSFLLGLVAVVEILAGIALILGIWMRWAGYLLAVIMVVAIVWAKKVAFPSIELDLLMLASLLALAWNGPGVWSLHSRCNCCEENCNC